ncbi:iron-sulfur cluster carrier protein ApbC [Aliidiomarina shirensis]|uniref:Iron-sulfur cluster carrier protein n=1 Tax=Aliidiomarina shirensis TaxID=1048642 RepID=A0A432WWZ6_9GAMM|nr:iron-sulfur cluster carrier protein ApbC [Aliidiomarina shirensis]RUO38275.1 iron-sulfur cluster carrier protein ApbC [Aliidiomarina shirensis]
MANDVQRICAELRSSIFSSGFAADWLQINGQKITLTLPFAAKSGAEALIASEPRLQEYDWDIRLNITALPAKEGKAPQGSAFPNIKNIIAVASGKGGVGKSAVTLSLAKALQAEGARVGILDGDIYGPSLPTMFGNQGEQLTFTPNRKMLPVNVFGIEGNSLGYLVDASAAAIWRGPMASRAVEQLFFDTQWAKLDYLLVDLPPGTGDIQLTLSQNFPLTAAIVVTTPQNIALADAQKGIAMFQKVDVPVIGLIENMSYFECTSCGHQEAIFGSQGGSNLAAKHHVPLLGKWPLTTALRESLDAGKPLQVRNPNHLLNAIMSESAQQMAANAWELITADIG